MTASVADRQLYRRADGSAWVGEVWVGRTPADAVATAPLPAEDDPRWISGKPTVLDTQVLTLCPFYPSGQLGVSVERKSSHPLGRYPNHPPFEGARAWMPLDRVQWEPVAAVTPEAPQAPVPAARSRLRRG
jgi:hypothetical protein